MKKIFDSKLFYFVLGAMIFSGITVCASTTYLSNQVVFTSTNSEWNVNNVEDALNDLYNKQNNTTTNEVIGAYSSYKKATGWNDDGMEYSISNSDAYFTYDVTARKITSKYTGKISVKLMIFNTGANSSKPQLSLYKNGTSVLTYQGVTPAAAAAISEEYIIDIAEGDILTSYMYGGGGNYSYYVTQISTVE